MSMMKNRKLQIAISTFLVFGILYVFKHERYHQGYNWEKGIQVYELYFRNVIRTSSGVIKNAMANMEMRGLINFKVYQVGEENVNTVFEFSDVRIKVNSHDSEVLKSLFETPFFVNFSKEGEIQNYVFTNTISVEDEDIVKDVMNSLQIIVKESMFGGYKTNEKDKHGEFIAKYNLQEEKDGKFSLSKIKKDYHTVTPFSTKDSYEMKIRINESETKAAFYASGKRENGKKSHSWLDHIEYEEQITLLYDNKPYIKISKAQKLKLLDVLPSQDLLIASGNLNFNELKESWQSLAKNNVSIMQLTQISEFEKNFGNKSLSEVVAEILGKNDKFDIRNLRKIMLYLKYKPDAAYDIPEILLSQKSLNPTDRVTLVHALERVNTPQAEHALQTILTSSAHERDSRVQAAVALGNISNPTRRSVDSLWNAYGQRDEDEDAAYISNTAVLSLGSIANKNDDFGSTDEARKLSDEIKSNLKAELSASTDVNKKVAVLRSIGNTGDSSIIESIESYYEDTDYVVRSAVVNAVGVLEDKESNEILTEKLQIEANVNVRTIIMETLFENKPTGNTIPVVLKELQKEKNDIVKGKMYQYLLKNREEEQVKNTLQNMLRQESNAYHRKLITTAIYTKKKKPEGEKNENY